MATLKLSHLLSLSMSFEANDALGYDYFLGWLRELLKVW